MGHGTNDWFGTHCQYSFDREKYSDKSFDETVTAQVDYKTPLHLDYTRLNKTPFTCYISLNKCNSALCLDWRQICDGNFNCENGEDEPRDCLELKLNECEDNEYRCRNGMCIPKTFLLDFSPDCMDLDDEHDTYLAYKYEVEVSP
ncbi:unnamed protein product [Didymodactylos carnosus]|uniref:Uncharacterized protein n=1 Tax=Didymodactylos carnosus TaxID=1234261 RepID=A0A814IW17_9BILA|nr:unnamed protein product [Didymodactylos carnosus]CAF1029272.1 unnamed protein product [Didymodactylos carnosus]CAF3555399.1 unnamed protein product [Didymodactylos carnosus]CAF3800206.1 unnamed protein product [Didymodactylos carnosus]